MLIYYMCVSFQSLALGDESGWTEHRHGGWRRDAALLERLSWSQAVLWGWGGGGGGLYGAVPIGG
jgi:hypothetical protein